MSLEKKPICVDLDGTLVNTDLFVESLIALLKKNPFYVFLIPLWLAKGKAFLKRQVSLRVSIDVGSLPYNGELLEYLHDARQRNRPLVLATASDYLVASRVAKHLGIFSDVLASDGKINLSGTRKLETLREHFGSKGFDYAGNARVDRKVWVQADESILVNASKRLAVEAACKFNVTKTFDSQKKCRLVLFRAIRLHQWSKNLLVFVPLLLAHKAADWRLTGDGILSFLAFSLAASAVYVMNDLFDLEVDRNHPRKRNRPLPSGDLNIVHGIALVPLLLGGSLLVSLALPARFGIVLSLYLALTTAYSLYFKKIVLIDVVLLASLYTIRIIAGAFAVGVKISPWLLAFSMFIFLSLAFIKRYSELFMMRNENMEISKGRGYLAGDLEQIARLGTSSGYISVLVLALYINGAEVVELYRHPYLLWMICPLFLYWISRIWLYAARGAVHEDPIVYAIKDKTSYVIGVLAGIILFMAA